MLAAAVSCGLPALLLCCALLCCAGEEAEQWWPELLRMLHRMHIYNASYKETHVQVRLPGKMVKCNQWWALERSCWGGVCVGCQASRGHMQLNKPRWPGRSFQV